MLSTSLHPVPGPRPGSPFRSTALSLGALLAGAAMIALAFLISPVEGLDFRVYLSGGQSVLDGRGELYTKELVYREGSSLLFTYPPFAALVFALLAPLGPDGGLLVFTLLSLGIAAATAVLGVRHIFRQSSVAAVLTQPRLRALALAGVGLVTLLGPWRETMAFGQINILLFGLIMADFLTKRAGWPTGLLTGLAAGIKLTPLVFGWYFLVRGDWRGLRNMAAGFLMSVGLGFLLLPAESRTYWLELLPDTSRIGGAGYVDNLNITGAILHFAGADFPVRLPWLALSLLAVAVAAFIIRRAAARGEALTGVAATALLMLLISPVSWSHHWVWVALFLAVLARNLRDFTRQGTALRRWGTGLLASGLAIFLLSPKSIGFLLGASDLDSQLPAPWLMASSIGVFWAVGLMAWGVALRGNHVRGAGPDAAGHGAESTTEVRTDRHDSIVPEGRPA
ncbi:Polyprenol-phosphate-mannose-dependent alpha-(1-2)-phosphatidylinositol mannoside mannosyltransferase [Arthrobacter saudimassiliensis]|uniref:Polyprenol-phosphate-mannose-dependent alpha-(1-2)-phosphatidylinositol mannoside mannosyltransferase n=1 Tax=Arthrobacter saudimassiliensis TaxID=1461584 RepID=A0A078MKU6_9MICC|nr:Polyprenol-phosphate-mannose-dependent alpha-(1-2)-phosphatidylinositol mannoside mannosyltransferase [Arthrobacter saudimassiliensis]